MEKFIKQLPLVALLLAFTVFVGKASVQALSTSSTTMWVYNPGKGFPATDPRGYDEAPGAGENDCSGQAQVCLVEAPDVGGQPDLSSELIDAIRDGNPHQNLTYGAFSGN